MSDEPAKEGEETDCVETVSGHTSSNVKVCFEWVLRSTLSHEAQLRTKTTDLYAKAGPIAVIWRSICFKLCSYCQYSQQGQTKRETHSFLRNGPYPDRNARISIVELFSVISEEVDKPIKGIPVSRRLNSSVINSQVSNTLGIRRPPSLSKHLNVIKEPVIVERQYLVSDWSVEGNQGLTDHTFLPLMWHSS